MKRNPSPLSGLFAAAGMLALILDSRTALAGAAEGIDLCIRTVIPALFPFFLLSVILTGSAFGLELPLLRPIGKLCSIPRGAESILLTGLLGGYPVGAQCVSQAYAAGQLRKEDAERMLGFCSNAGPAFLFGMTGQLFQNKAVPFLLWGIHIASALITGTILPGRSTGNALPAPARKPQAGQALTKSIKITASVCGWVVIFRIVIAFARRWFLWLFPVTVQVIFTGILELTNGYLELIAVENESLRFILASCFLSFGGLCVGLQTVSVTADAGLSLRHYFPGKLTQTAVSASLSAITAGFLFHSPAPCCPIVTILPWIPYFIFRKNKKNSSSIPTASGV